MDETQSLGTGGVGAELPRAIAFRRKASMPRRNEVKHGPDRGWEQVWRLKTPSCAPQTPIENSHNTLTQTDLSAYCF